MISHNDITKKKKSLQAVGWWKGLPLLFAFGVDDRSFSESHRRDEIADAHALLFCGFDDFLRLFWGVVREDGPSPHDAHPAAHDGLLVVHLQILAKCIPGEGLSRLREHWKATLALAGEARRASRSGRQIWRLQSFDMTQAEFAVVLVISQEFGKSVDRLLTGKEHAE
jgi:hypothetical protein